METSKFRRKEKKMKQRMKETSALMIVAIVVLLVQCGCGSGPAAKTGFLSDYSQLRSESSTTLRNVNRAAVARYSNFIVDPVKVHFHSGAKAIELRTKGKLTQRQLTDLTNYLHAKITQVIRESGKRIAYQPAAGVARVRVALTDISGSSAASLVPTAKLMGAGIGGASMEAEVIDSMTGQQIGAVVESKKGSNIPFANLGEWDAARQVIDDWAKRLKKTLQ